MKIRKNELTVLEMVCGSPSDIDNLVQKFPRDDFPVVFMNYHVDIRKTNDGLPVVVIPEGYLSDAEVSQLVKVFSNEYLSIKKKSRAIIDVRLSRVKKQIISGNLPLTIIPPTSVISRAKCDKVIQLEVKGN